MDFNYVAKGSVLTGNCAEVVLVQNWPHLFNVGDILYSLWHARRQGKLYKICVKSLRYFNEPGNPFSPLMCERCFYTPLYVDTWNGYHNEEDLGTYQEALDLIEQYNILQQHRLEIAVRDRC